MPTATGTATKLWTATGSRHETLPDSDEDANTISSASRIPSTTMSWNVARTKSRMADGLVSAWYMGASTESAPMATPSSSFPAANCGQKVEVEIWTAMPTMLKSATAEMDLTSPMAHDDEARRPARRQPTSEPMGNSATMRPWIRGGKPPGERRVMKSGRLKRPPTVPLCFWSHV